MTPRLADPVLPLQTMNAHCMAVRIAALEAQNPASLPTQTLDTLLTEVEFMIHRLRMIYSMCRDDAGLTVRCETAGKAVQRLQYGLKGRKSCAVGGV